jgi:hypothetical protein
MKYIFEGGHASEKTQGNMAGSKPIKVFEN